MTTRLPLLAVPVLLGAGCGVGPSAQQPLQVGSSFEQLLAAGDTEGACRLLAVSARRELDGGCALLQELPAASGPGAAQVRGRMAVLRYEGDTVFLARSPGEGWQVLAAGCERSNPDRPYSCTVDGG